MTILKGEKLKIKENQKVITFTNANQTKPNQFHWMSQLDVPTKIISNRLANTHTHMCHKCTSAKRPVLNLDLGGKKQRDKRRRQQQNRRHCIAFVEHFTIQSPTDILVSMVYKYKMYFCIYNKTIRGLFLFILSRFYCEFVGLLLTQNSVYFLGRERTKKLKTYQSNDWTFSIIDMLLTARISNTYSIGNYWNYCCLCHNMEITDKMTENQQCNCLFYLDKTNLARSSFMHFSFPSALSSSFELNELTLQW